jgi:hypothetical protein
VSVRTLLASVTILASTLGGVSCSPSCATLQGHIGIVLSVRDARTGTSLDSTAIVTVERLTPPQESRTGSIVDVGGGNPLSITGEREGRYSVRIGAAGYSLWAQEVRVPSATEACNNGDPMSVSVNARLDPAS